MRLSRTVPPVAPGSDPVEAATLHAVGWLVAGNAVGLLLATLLLAPRVGDWLSPLTYGRWMPVHYNLHLYGWCGLALVALLFRIYPGQGRVGRWALLSIGLWSGTLLVAALSRLAGHTSGMPFLEWSGAARFLLVANLSFLAFVLIAAVFETTRTGTRLTQLARWTLAGKCVLLAGLCSVPVIMFHVTTPGVDPPINPSSGGPTGVSLMGSTLGVVFIVLLFPWAAGLRARRGARAAGLPFALLAAHLGVFLLLDHGNHSNHEPAQIAALASLLVWFPILRRFLSGFDWPDACRSWLGAVGAWGGALLATAIPTFLPGVLDRWKFTNALVGHAHLAMAGFVSALLVVLLAALNRDGALAGLFEGRAAFWLWNAGNAVHVGSMLVLGSLEGRSPGLLFRDAPVVGALYGVRWVAGGAMLLASILWARAGFRLVGRRLVPSDGAELEWHHAA